MRVDHLSCARIRVGVCDFLPVPSGEQRCHSWRQQSPPPQSAPVLRGGGGGSAPHTRQEADVSAPRDNRANQEGSFVFACATDGAGELWSLLLNCSLREASEEWTRQVRRTAEHRISWFPSLLPSPSIALFCSGFLQSLLCLMNKDSR